MTTLADDSHRDLILGDRNDPPSVASDITYEGAAVGDNGSGYGRPLVAGDKFRGFCEEKCDNSSGSAGDKNIRTLKKGKVELSISGAVITDVGQPVYASDDDTFTFVAVGNSYIGKAARFVSSGVMNVEFDADGIDPFGENDNRETISADKTLDAQDTGKIFYVDTDAKTITLPATATAGRDIVIVNAGAAAAVAINISPNASDKIMGPDLAGVDDKDLINTKATARRGDYVRISLGHADGAIVQEMKGTWAAEA